MPPRKVMFLGSKCDGSKLEGGRISWDTGIPNTFSRFRAKILKLLIYIRKVSEEWRTASKTTTARGVNKPKSSLKKSNSWIRERPQLPEEPVLKEPPWLDLVRKRRWRLVFCFLLRNISNPTMRTGSDCKSVQFEI